MSYLDDDGALVESLLRGRMKDERIGEEIFDRVMHRWGVVQGPIGEALVIRNDKGIKQIFPLTSSSDLANRIASLNVPIVKTPSVMPEIEQAMLEGDGSSLAYDLSDRGSFEREVWAYTLTIPKGIVASYGEVAKGIGAPRAYRAVGSALGRNPVPLLIPCHRVVRADGSVGEYGFGTSYKVALLRSEGVMVDDSLRVSLS
ncbi:MAG: methylated-DNA--[protein]-cysteine S-methyltransferase [Acidimicrobiales bacterium]